MRQVRQPALRRRSFRRLGLIMFALALIAAGLVAWMCRGVGQRFVFDDTVLGKGGKSVLVSDLGPPTIAVLLAAESPDYREFTETERVYVRMLVRQLEEDNRLPARVEVLVWRRECLFRATRTLVAIGAADSDCVLDIAGETSGSLEPVLILDSRGGSPQQACTPVSAK